MSTVTYDKAFRPTRHLDERDYYELTRAAISHRLAWRPETRTLAWYRLLDILNPLNEPMAPVVPIESLAPDAEG